MTTSKKILPGIKFCGWAELIMSHHCFLLDSKTVHAWELLKPMSLRLTRLYASMSFHAPPYLNLFQKKKASLIICHLEQHPVNWLFQIQANEFNFPNPVGAQNTGVLIFVGRHCIKKRYYGRNSSAWKSTADREKGLYHCLEEEDGVSLENWKLWHLKGKKERKPHANLSCCCELWKPFFKILLIYFLKSEASDPASA